MFHQNTNTNTKVSEKKYLKESKVLFTLSPNLSLIQEPKHNQTNLKWAALHTLSPAKHVKAKEYKYLFTKFLNERMHIHRLGFEQQPSKSECHSSFFCRSLVDSTSCHDENEEVFLHKIIW